MEKGSRSHGGREEELDVTGEVGKFIVLQVSLALTSIGKGFLYLGFCFLILFIIVAIGVSLQFSITLHNLCNEMSHCVSKDLILTSNSKLLTGVVRRAPRVMRIDTLVLLIQSGHFDCKHFIHYEK